MPANGTAAEPGFPGSVVIDGVTCYTREDEPGTWWYVPGDPVPEIAGAEPAVRLWVSPPTSVLQLGVDWAVPSDLLARVESALAQANGTQTVDLRLAPASVREVTLEAGSDARQRDVLAVSASSGFPPYRAVFRVDLDAARTNDAAAALNGRKGLLLVRYRVAAPLKASARVRLEGDVEPAVASFDASATPHDVRGWVDQAIAAGRLHMTQERSESADEALARRARELCIERFTLLLDQALRSRQGAAGAPPAVGTRTRLRAEATVSDIVQQEFERLADVSAWIAPGNGGAHITVLPGGGGTDPAPPAGPLKVGLGFRADDLPVAFIEARCGDQKAVLRGPRFEGATFESPRCDDGLVVTTHFTTGSQPFRLQVAAADAGRLPPAALGLVEIVVDGRERRDSGAREIRVRLQFRPAGPEPGEDRTFYLRDDAWVASFFLVSRGAAVAGEWRLDWREKTRDGQERRHRVTANDQTVFVLRETEPDPGANS